jgi:CDP-paratose 2-epimerase
MIREAKVDRAGRNRGFPAPVERPERPVSEKRSPAGRTSNDLPWRVLITGGAGFIGTNLAAHLAGDGCEVVVFDNLSRPGVRGNLDWLRTVFDGQVEFLQADVRDAAAVRRAVAGCDAVFHFAAQVAVTTSLVDPDLDFEINARGTLNVLEACRRLADPPRLLFTSTNKVYGSLREMPLRKTHARYLPVDASVAAAGVNEEWPLDLHSPYGCSKGCADQYVLDYARCWHLPATVFRMSCIYGPHQRGTEDQGWVAHFARQLLDDEEITLYGDGDQGSRPVVCRGPDHSDGGGDFQHRPRSRTRI